MALTPFTKQQLLPQEEKLEISRNKSELFIGIPKETSYQERRICLTPDAVQSLTAHGHRILMEAGAGESSSYSDTEYSDAGAEITQDTKKVFSCPILLKVEPPTMAEIELMQFNAIIISAIQLKTRKKEYFEAQLLQQFHVHWDCFECILQQLYQSLSLHKYQFFLCIRCYYIQDIQQLQK